HTTLQFTLAGIGIATALGVLLGVARLSRIWIVSVLSRAYVEILRNTPLLLQLLFCDALPQSLPPPDRALQPLPGVFLCVRGLFFPSVDLFDGHCAVEWPVRAGFDFHGGVAMLPELMGLVLGPCTGTA